MRRPRGTLVTRTFLPGMEVVTTTPGPNKMTLHLLVAGLGSKPGSVIGFYGTLDTKHRRRSDTCIQHKEYPNERD